MWDHVYAPVKPNKVVKEHITSVYEKADAVFIFSAEMLI